MTKVIILGAGNLATHLYHAFRKSKEVQVVQLYNRSIHKLAVFEKEVAITDNLLGLGNADVYIIAASDDAVPLIYNTIHLEKKLVVHTSGSVPMQELSTKNRKGVFYPLQTFSKGRQVNFKNIPVCVEAEEENDLKLLHQLAGTISDQVFEISSEQRKSLHLAAVFVNNFTNHLYGIGNTICKENQLPFNILRPLISETAKKIEDLSPYEAQTGPAKRNDIMTMERHLNQLNNKMHKELYILLSESIKKTHGQKL